MGVNVPTFHKNHSSVSATAIVSHLFGIFPRNFNKNAAFSSPILLVIPRPVGISIIFSAV